jgi:hypothetical protein
LALRVGAAVRPGGRTVTFRILVNGRRHWTWLAHGGMPWCDGRVDLTPYRGRPILLSLVTDSTGSGHSDWAVWAEPRLVPRD